MSRPTPLDTLRHCLDQLAYNLPPQERERYVQEGLEAVDQLTGREGLTRPVALAEAKP